MCQAGVPRRRRRRQAPSRTARGVPFRPWSQRTRRPGAGAMQHVCVLEIPPSTRLSESSDRFRRHLSTAMSCRTKTAALSLGVLLLVRINVVHPLADGIEAIPLLIEVAAKLAHDLASELGLEDLAGEHR